MTPLYEPFIVLYNGHGSLDQREGTKSSKVVLVSSCWFWEMDNFDLMLDYMRMFDLAGALLRPHAEALRPMMEMGAPLDDIFEAAKEAGRQLVRDGKMSAGTLATVSRELMPLESYIEFWNQRVREALDKLKK